MKNTFLWVQKEQNSVRSASTNLRGSGVKTWTQKKKRKGNCVGRFAESYPVKSEAQGRNCKAKPPVKRL